MAPMHPDTVREAVEITKAAIPNQNGHWINDPGSVAKFIQTVAEKLHELRTTSVKNA